MRATDLLLQPPPLKQPCDAVRARMPRPLSSLHPQKPPAGIQVPTKAGRIYSQRPMEKNLQDLTVPYMHEAFDPKP